MPRCSDCCTTIDVATAGGLDVKSIILEGENHSSSFLCAQGLVDYQQSYIQVTGISISPVKSTAVINVKREQHQMNRANVSSNSYLAFRERYHHHKI